MAALSLGGHKTSAVVIKNISTLTGRLQRPPVRFVRGEKKKPLFSTLLLHLLYSSQKICNEDFLHFTSFSWWKRVIY